MLHPHLHQLYPTVIEALQQNIPELTFTCMYMSRDNLKFTRKVSPSFHSYHLSSPVTSDLVTVKAFLSPSPHNGDVE